MHNSKKNLKTVLRAVCIVCVLALVFWGLDFLLYPCTFTRNDVHSAVTGQYDDIYLGTSHGKMDIDPESMEEVSGRTGLNLCVGGEYAMDAYYLMRLILEKGQQPSRVVYEVSPGYFTSEKEEGNNYLLFYHEFPLSRAKLEYFFDAVLDCDIRTMLFPWYEYDLDYELEHAAETVSKKWNRDYGISDLKSDTQEYHESGFVERYAVDTSSLSMADLGTFGPDSIITENMDYLEKLIDLCEDNGIEFIAVVTPIPQETLSAYADDFSAVYQYFDEFFAENDVRCINFNGSQYYSLFSHEIEAYTDYDGHLNGDSAREFSKLLAQILDNTYEFPTESTTEDAVEQEAAG